MSEKGNDEKAPSPSPCPLVPPCHFPPPLLRRRPPRWELRLSKSLEKALNFDMTQEKCEGERETI